MTSKEIAIELGLSPHTVDQRIRGALKTLGVERRTDAARMVLLAQEQPRQRVIWLPWATARLRHNEIPIAQRLLWILLIAIAASFAAGLSLAGLESVITLIRT